MRRKYGSGCPNAESDDTDTIVFTECSETNHGDGMRSACIGQPERRDRHHRDGRRIELGRTELHPGQCLVRQPVERSAQRDGYVGIRQLLSPRWRRREAHAAHRS